MKIYIVSLLAAAGLVVGCNKSVESASTKFNELPPAVQQCVLKRRRRRSRMWREKLRMGWKFMRLNFVNQAAIV